MGGIENFFNPTMGQGQFQQQLIGKDTNAGQLLGQRRHMYEDLAGGQVPAHMRNNIMGAAGDTSAMDAFNTQGMIGMGGMQGSGIGAMLNRVSSSGRGNEAIKQMANLTPSLMQMGLQGLGDVQQTYQGAQKAGLEYQLGNMAQKGANRRGFAGTMLGLGMNFLGMPSPGGGGQQGSGVPPMQYQSPPVQQGYSSFSLGPPDFQLSDIRLKKDIELKGKSPEGVNVYSFKYKGNDETYQGVMAQEVPWASIKGDDGYYLVDYSKVDVEFKELD